LDKVQKDYERNMLSKDIFKTFLAFTTDKKITNKFKTAISRNMDSPINYTAIMKIPQK
jgi:hypothetical protein